MTSPENEISNNRYPKKHFFKVPDGIQEFSDEQIDAWAECIYNQIVQSSDSDQSKTRNENLTETGGEK